MEEKNAEIERGSEEDRSLISESQGAMRSPEKTADKERRTSGRSPTEGRRVADETGSPSGSGSSVEVEKIGDEKRRLPPPLPPPPNFQQGDRGPAEVPKVKLENKNFFRDGLSRFKATDGSPDERSLGRKEKRTIGALKSSLEKKMVIVEKKLEDRVERIWEENVERHPWLHPIETWITDRYKSSSNPHGPVTLLEQKRRDSEDEAIRSVNVAERETTVSEQRHHGQTKEAHGSLAQEQVREMEQHETHVVKSTLHEAEQESREMDQDAREVEERTRELERMLEDLRQRSEELEFKTEASRSAEESLDADRTPRGADGSPKEASPKMTHESSETRSVLNYEFKYTPATRDDEEPKLESRVIEHLKNLKKKGSPKSERAGFDPATLLSRIKKMEASLRSGSLEELATIDSSGSRPDGVLDVKEVRHHNHDLFDKFKDNVKGKMEDIHRYFQRTNRLADVNRRLKSQIWSSVVTIVLVEAKNLLPMDIDGLSDPYVKFRLGTEKYKSKVVNKTLNPVWLEQFDLHLYEDPYLGQELEVTVWDRDRSHQDDLMGRAVIDLAVLERETTHRLWRDLEDGSGSIFLLLTISGTTASETISDLAAHEETPQESTRLLQKYALLNSLQRPRDVGHLTVKVYRAQGLAAADLGGKSDPFCVLELVNARLQTQTEYKTLAPNWQKIFTFNVKDINSVLEVTVYDEDRDHKVEFLGKVAIPLLRIRNGEKRWYALKDKKLRGRAKGNSPQILLEMTVVWNVIRACVRTLNPKEKKYMEPEMKFKRQVFLRNVLRLKAIIVIFIDMGKYIQSCWEWESRTRSSIALVLFILGCYYFEPYMIPTVALLIMLKYYLLRGERSGLNQWISEQVAVVTGASLTHHSGLNLQDVSEVGSDDCPPTPGDDDDDEDDKDKEEKKSLKERLQAIQEVTQTVQNSIGYIASLCERVKNLFNFTVPYLSYLGMILAILGACVLYLIPVRYLILVWGVNKFSRKLLRPHSVPNNEVLDLISRVPDDEELLNYRELKPLPTADCERGSFAGTSSGSSARRDQRKRHKVA